MAKESSWREVHFDAVKLGSKVKIKFTTGAVLIDEVTYVSGNSDSRYNYFYTDLGITVTRDATDVKSMWIKDPNTNVKIGTNVRATHTSGAVLTGVVSENFDGLGISIEGVATVWGGDGWKWEKHD